MNTSTTNLEMRMIKLKNGQAAGKDEVTGEIIKTGVQLVVK